MNLQVKQWAARSQWFRKPHFAIAKLAVDNANNNRRKIKLLYEGRKNKSNN